MKLRLIVLSLAFLSLIAVTTGSFLYYSILKRTVLAEANRRAASDAAAISNMFSAYLNENAKSVKTLAGMDTIKAVLQEPNRHNLAAANLMLDHFQQSLGTDVCYLMNTAGLTLARQAAPKQIRRPACRGGYAFETSIIHCRRHGAGAF